jgi:hypothetical protein
LRFNHLYTWCSQTLIFDGFLALAPLLAAHDRDALFVFSTWPLLCWLVSSAGVFISSCSRAALLCASSRRVLCFQTWQPLREAYLHALMLSFRFFRTPLFWEALDRDAFSTQGPFLVLSHRFHEVSTTGGIGI